MTRLMLRAVQIFATCSFLKVNSLRPCTKIFLILNGGLALLIIYGIAVLSALIQSKKKMLKIWPVYRIHQNQVKCFIIAVIIYNSQNFSCPYNTDVHVKTKATLFKYLLTEQNIYFIHSEQNI